MSRTLTKEELAARLDGCEYEDEGLKEIFAAASWETEMEAMK